MPLYELPHTGGLTIWRPYSRRLRVVTPPRAKPKTKRRTTKPKTPPPLTLRVAPVHVDGDDAAGKDER